MKTVGGYRLRHELELVLKEKEPENVCCVPMNSVF